MPPSAHHFSPGVVWRRLLALAAGWFPAYRADEGIAAHIRARQLQAVSRLTPLAMVTNLLNVLLVLLACWNTGPRWGLAPWGGALCTIALRGLWVWQRRRHSPPRDTASPAALKRAVFHAAVLAALWAALPVMVFAGATSEVQLLVATVVTGMICAGGFALATVPAAGTAYVIVLGLGAAAALGLSGLALGPAIAALLLLYCVIVITSVWNTARLFGARLLAEAEAGRQNEVIGLLLRDFEEHASDVLWEIGPDGRLRHISHRLEELFGMSYLALAAAPVLQILTRLAPADDEAREQLDVLREQLTAGRPFRDVVVALARGTRTRWWSLSAKPLLDEHGHGTGWRGVARDITAARRANRQLSWLAHNDALTGLANRHQFRSLLAKLLAGADPPPLAVLCLDLDHFKSVNDSLGHAAGDALLRVVSERLLAVTRRGDTVARLAGDEFALLVRADDPAEIEPLSQRLLVSLRQPCEIAGVRVATRASIGVALAPGDGKDVDTLMNHADLALYAAKSAGRDEVRFFSAEMALSTRRRVALEQALRQALTHGELRLVFQPQVRLSDWRIEGFEALLRWRHPVFGDVPPAEFVPVAEDAGLMPVIGDWVMHQACREAATWPQAIPVSVNVSPVQAMTPDFVDRVLAAAKAGDLPLSRLELEITESLFLQESATTTQALHALHRAGVRLALDDFGTGYSALAYLRRFPLQTLKIDRSFVRELSAGGNARSIVRMIVGLARTLNMRTVAEGVEEPAHAAVLDLYGCDLLQGWLTSRPVEAVEVPSLISTWSQRPRPVFEAPAPTAPMPLDSTT